MKEFEELDKLIKEAVVNKNITSDLIGKVRESLTCSNGSLDVNAISKFKEETGMKITYRKVHDLEKEMYAVAVVCNGCGIEFAII